MTAKSKRPSADAGIDELQAWAARANRAAVSPVGASAPYPGVPATTREPEPSGRRDARRGSLLPKVLLAVGAAAAAYLVISFVIGLLMTLLMIAGGVALIYAVYRIGRRHGSS